MVSQAHAVRFLRLRIDLYIYIIYKRAVNDSLSIPDGEDHSNIMHVREISSDFRFSGCFRLRQTMQVIYKIIIIIIIIIESYGSNSHIGFVPYHEYH